mmetsp:Transcript_12611/g.35443  ORF Transcript_12611/g.35443 Transcript_12611/m.35443 type:complete len:323 (+) Transcript_12611:1537-2505(+)
MVAGAEQLRSRRRGRGADRAEAAALRPRSRGLRLHGLQVRRGLEGGQVGPQACVLQLQILVGGLLPNLPSGWSLGVLCLRKAFLVAGKPLLEDSGHELRGAGLDGPSLDVLHGDVSEAALLAGGDVDLTQRRRQQQPQLRLQVRRDEGVHVCSEGLMPLGLALAQCCHAFRQLSRLPGVQLLEGPAADHLRKAGSVGSRDAPHKAQLCKGLALLRRNLLEYRQLVAHVADAALLGADVGELLVHLAGHFVLCLHTASEERLHLSIAGSHLRKLLLVDSIDSVQVPAESVWHKAAGMAGRQPLNSFLDLPADFIVVVLQLLQD